MVVALHLLEFTFDSIVVVGTLLALDCHRHRRRLPMPLTQPPADDA